MNWNPSNLEWCTVTYNNRYSNVNAYAIAVTQKPVIAMFPNGTIKDFPNVSEAARQLGIGKILVSNCAAGKQKQTHGIRFKFRAIDVIEGRQKLGKPHTISGNDAEK